MTGSGSCVFVAFENESDALIAKEELPSKWVGFVAKAIDGSPDLLSSKFTCGTIT